MQCEGGHAATFVAGPTTRRFDDRSWLPARRIAEMDANGIERQVLSPLPELLGYWFEPAATAALCRHVNDTLAKMVDAAPARFSAFGGLPMNDAALAISEARRLKRMGFAGVEIGSNIEGISPADARHAEVLAALHELDLCVFVHGIRPATEGRLVGPAVLGAIVGIPMDTALCVASFIGARVLDRLPRLRVAFSHGGGGFGAVLDRLQHVWSVMPELREQLPRSPQDEARRFFYDALTFGSDYARFLVDRIGADRIFVGTDFPAGGMALMDPQAFVATLQLGGDDEAKLLRGTALSYLKLDG
jgi:aminocarboxymuconate-semialdehyde decarboxylase